jgi:hypothetical protein
LAAALVAPEVSTKKLEVTRSTLELMHKS